MAEESALIKKCINGDSAAYTELIDRYKDAVYAVAYSKLRNHAHAQDVAQEAFIKAYQSLHRLKDHTKVAAWLHRITLNTCSDWFRKNKHAHITVDFMAASESRFLIEAKALDAAQEEAKAERGKAIMRECIDSLSEKLKEVIILKYFEGLPYSDIANILGVPFSTVDGRIRRARRALKVKYERLMMRKVDDDVPEEEM